MHLTETGSGKLATNFINKVRRLWRLINSFHATNLISSVTVSPNDADTSDSQNLQFKKQSENQNLSESLDEIAHHLKLKKYESIGCYLFYIDL